MNLTLLNRCRWSLVVAIILAGAAGAGIAIRAAENRAPQLKLDDSPLQRDARSGSSYSSVVKKVAPGVVNIYTTRKVKVDRRSFPGFPSFPFFDNPEEEYGRTPRPRTQREQSLGSGVIISKDGFILSNNHVIDGADEIRVVLSKEKKEFIAKVIGKDPKTDLAVLKVESDNLPYATLGDSDKLEVGDVVLAIGNPFGLGQTVTSGIISALNRGDLPIDVAYEDFIQTDAAINPGNSGGALVDAEGRLIGINTAIISRTGGNQGVGFAIPINMARHVMTQLIEKGRVSRGYLGLLPQDLDSDLAREFKIADGNGALVAQVTENSAAEEAGIKPGDVITHLNGKPVTGAGSFRLMVSKNAPGTKVELKLLREGRERVLKATLRELPEQFETASVEREKESESSALEGVEVGDLTAQARNRFRIPQDVKGAVITNVDPESASYLAGLRAGDVILEINRKKVSSADDAVELSKKVKGDRALVWVWSRGATRFVTVDESKTK